MLQVIVPLYNGKLQIGDLVRPLRMTPDKALICPSCMKVVPHLIVQPALATDAIHDHKYLCEGCTKVASSGYIRNIRAAYDDAAKAYLRSMERKRIDLMLHYKKLGFTIDDFHLWAVVYHTIEAQLVVTLVAAPDYDSAVERALGSLDKSVMDSVVQALEVTDSAILNSFDYLISFWPYTYSSNQGVYPEVDEWLIRKYDIEPREALATTLNELLVEELSVSERRAYESMTYDTAHGTAHDIEDSIE